MQLTQRLVFGPIRHVWPSPPRGQFGARGATAYKRHHIAGPEGCWEKAPLIAPLSRSTGNAADLAALEAASGGGHESSYGSRIWLRF